jgi:hypothetical protein
MTPIVKTNRIYKDKRQHTTQSFTKAKDSSESFAEVLQREMRKVRD